MIKIELTLLFFVFFTTSCVNTVQKNANKKNEKNRDTNECSSIPFDNTAKDTSLTNFVKKLKNITSNKDWDALMEVLSKDIRNSFFESIDTNSISEFKKIWWYKENSSNVFKLISRLLDFGGNYRESDTSCLYPSFIFHEKNCPDEFKTNFGYCTSDKLNLYEKPDINSKIVRILSFNLIYILKSDNQGLIKLNELEEIEAPDWWIFVETTDGKFKGYLQRKNIFNICDYTLRLKKLNGHWKITELDTGEYP